MRKPNDTPVKFDEELGKVSFEELRRRRSSPGTYILLLVLTAAIVWAVVKFGPRAYQQARQALRKEAPAPDRREPRIPGVDVPAPGSADDD